MGNFPYFASASAAIAYPKVTSTYLLRSANSPHRTKLKNENGFRASPVLDGRNRSDAVLYHLSGHLPKVRAITVRLGKRPHVKVLSRVRGLIEIPIRLKIYNPIMYCWLFNANLVSNLLLRRAVQPPVPCFCFLLFYFAAPGFCAIRLCYAARIEANSRVKSLIETKELSCVTKKLSPQVDREGQVDCPTPRLTARVNPTISVASFEVHF